MHHSFDSEPQIKARILFLIIAFINDMDFVIFRNYDNPSKAQHGRLMGVMRTIVFFFVIWEGPFSHYMMISHFIDVGSC